MQPASRRIARIAMWSGPRNISTAMMRSWAQRDDTIVCDEPLYAHYLAVTGLDHPGADEVIAHHDADWRSVVGWLTGPLPEGKTVFYQKHMAHHLLPEVGRDWLDLVEHVFLIREPREMLTSLVRRLEHPTLADTGLPQQLEIFQRVQKNVGRTPPVIDSRDVLENPEAVLRALCEQLELRFQPAMLSWPAGRRETDGIWARHWYDQVENSTGFRPFVPKSDPVPDNLADIHARCDELYQELHAHRLGAD